MHERWPTHQAVANGFADGALWEDGFLFVLHPGFQLLQERRSACARARLRLLVRPDQRQTPQIGDSEAEVDPIHVFSLYTGRLSPYQDRFNEEVRKAAIRHMQVIASDQYSFFYYKQYPILVEFFERISNCL
jgi:hypothetical protein